MTLRAFHYLFCLTLGLILLLSETPGARAADFEVIGAYGQQQSFVTTHDHYAYVAGGCNLRVLDIADPEHPKPIGYLRLENEVTQVLMKWPALYVAQARGAGMWIIDLTDPRHPRRHGKAIFKSSNATSEIEPSFRGSFLAVEQNSKGEKPEVAIYNITAPLNPIKWATATYGYDRPPFDFFISGSHLLIAHYERAENGTSRELLIEDRSTSPSKILARYPVSEEGEPHSAELNYDRVTGQLSLSSGAALLRTSNHSQNDSPTPHTPHFFNLVPLGAFV
jgi:hypothetical protein